MTVSLASGERVFAKLRLGRRRDAKREWHWLRALPELGFGTPRPLLHLVKGRRTLVATYSLPGRPLDVLLFEARDPQPRATAARYLERTVAPMVRRLHDTGLVYRDLYCNHLFAEHFEGGEPAFLDVERVFRPRLRHGRWHVKDLAGLCASAPDTVSRCTRLRFLRAYLGGLRGEWKALAAAVLRKAARIRNHRPKYG